MKIILLCFLSVIIIISINSEKSETKSNIDKNYRKILTETGWEPKIIGGIPVQLKSYKFAVRIVHSFSEDLNCGGSILNEIWVLTAAHCCTSGSGNTLNSWSFFIQPESSLSEYRNYVDIFVPHPNYTKIPALSNDICMVKLKYSLHKNKLQNITKELATPEFFEEVMDARNDEKCYVIGWGRKTPAKLGRSSPSLARVNLSLLNIEECRKAAGSHYISPDNVCTSNKGGVGPCKGDSGGPLMCRDIQVGIVSWGLKSCAESTKPTMYSRVDNHLEWIEHVILTGKGSLLNTFKFYLILFVSVLLILYNKLILNYFNVLLLSFK